TFKQGPYLDQLIVNEFDACSSRDFFNCCYQGIVRSSPSKGHDNLHQDGQQLNRNKEEPQRTYEGAERRRLYKEADDMTPCTTYSRRTCGRWVHHYR